MTKGTNVLMKLNFRWMEEHHLRQVVQVLSPVVFQEMSGLWADEQTPLETHYAGGLIKATYVKAAEARKTADHRAGTPIGPVKGLRRV